MRWPPDRREVSAILLALVILAALVFVVMNQDKIGKANSGFGPEWDCKPQPKGGSIRIKRP